MTTQAAPQIVIRTKSTGLYFVANKGFTAEKREDATQYDDTEATRAAFKFQYTGKLEFVSPSKVVRAFWDAAKGHTLTTVKGVPFYTVTIVLRDSGTGKILASENLVCHSRPAWFAKLSAAGRNRGC